MKLARAGRMRNRVTLEQPLEGSAGEFGDTPRQWQRVETVWAEVISRDGREFMATFQVHAEATDVVTIRYNPRVTPQCRFACGSRHLYIVSANSDLFNRITTCICRERLGEAK